MSKKGKKKSAQAERLEALGKLFSGIALLVTALAALIEALISTHTPYAGSDNECLNAPRLSIVTQSRQEVNCT